MKKLILLAAFLVMWKERTVSAIYLDGSPVFSQHIEHFDSLLAARTLARGKEKDEKVSDIHIYRLVEEGL